jgi:hypothetical protein
MGEQNRRAVDLEGTPGDEAEPMAHPHEPIEAPDPGERTALSPEADERQTRRQAPVSDDPGPGVDVGGVGYGSPAGR